MKTKKQNLQNAYNTAKSVQEAIQNPSFIRKEEFIPYCRTRDEWAIISIKFKRKICVEHRLSLDEYTEYKRLMKNWWKQ